MDWISLLKTQQADFLQRVKRPKTYDLSLLEGQVKGCHSEIMKRKTTYCESKLLIVLPWNVWANR